MRDQQNRVLSPMMLLLIAPILALIIRVGYNAALSQELTFDEPFYNELVSNILNGKGYMFDLSAYHTSVPGQPTSFQEPVYPFFLTAIYAVVGQDNYLVARMIHAVVGAITVFFIGLLAKEAFNVRAGVLAGLIAAVYPSLIYFNRLLMTESIFIFVFVIAIWLWLKAIKTGSLRWYFVTGIAFAICCLTRGMLLWFMPFLLLMTLIFAREKRWIKAVLLLIGLVICIAPWTIRNYAVHNAFVPITTKGGWNLYFYNYPLDNTDWNGTRYDDVPVPDVEGLSEVERERLYQRLGMESIRNNLGTIVRYGFLKLADFWDARLENPSLVLTLVNVVALYGVVASGLLATVKVIRKREVQPIHILLWFIIIFHSGMAMMFTGGGKARMPIEPALLILAGGGAAIILDAIISSGRLPGWLVRQNPANANIEARNA
jgi:4-amino-4-deoxy-L-arabinose transferase-like glycosyltransferase